MSFPEGTPLWRNRKAKFIDIYRGKRNPLVDYCWGGRGLNDPSVGLQYQIWRTRVTENGDVVLGSQRTGNGFQDEQVIFNHQNVESVTLAFDNSVQPSVCVKLAEQDRVLLYWFDSTPMTFVVTEFTGIVEPFLRIDDNRPGAQYRNDIVLSYNKNNQLMYRLQRDRYTVEYKLADIHKWQRIYQCGMTTELRFQWELVWDTDKILRDYCS